MPTLSMGLPPMGMGLPPMGMGLPPMQVNMPSTLPISPPSLPNGNIQQIGYLPGYIPFGSLQSFVPQIGGSNLPPPMIPMLNYQPLPSLFSSFPFPSASMMPPSMKQRKRRRINTE